LSDIKQARNLTAATVLPLRTSMDKEMTPLGFTSYGGPFLLPNFQWQTHGKLMANSFVNGKLMAN